MSPLSLFHPRQILRGGLLNRCKQTVTRFFPSSSPRRNRLFPFLLLILFLISRLNLHPDPPLRLTGTPISALIPHPGTRPPSSYFGINTRFVLFNSWYGQFNNQILSLINAISITRLIEGVLVLPCEKLGKESIRDSRFIKMRRLFSTRELVGDYFNYTLLSRAVHVVRPSQFLASVDGQELLGRSSIIVERKSGGYYRFLLNGRPCGLLPGETGVRVLNPNSTRSRLSSWCDFRAEKSLTHLQKLGTPDRFIFLPVLFRHHNANCSKKHPAWVTVRRYLQPRIEFQNAVDSFLHTLQRPVLAVHLRFFLNGDIGQFTPDSVVDMLYKRFADQIAQTRTIFVAYTPSSEESLLVVQLLRQRFRGQVIGGETIAKHLTPDAEYVMQLPLTNVLMDMWLCVKSDFFIGRIGSSMSWNIVYWRQALQNEYGLRAEHILPPLWYALTDFTTTGATRVEG